MPAIKDGSPGQSHVRGLTLPLPAPAVDALRETARVEMLSPRAVLLDICVRAVEQLGYRPDGTPLCADIVLGEGRYGQADSDILLRVVEGADGVALRLEISARTNHVSTEQQWQLWNHLITLLGPATTDVTGLARNLGARSSDTVAIEDERDRFSYRDLGRLSDAVSELGEPGTVVGVLGSASARFFATVFALYDAGLVYVPLDARQPTERSASMVRTAGCAVVIDTAESSPIAEDLAILAPVIGWSTVAALQPDIWVRRDRCQALSPDALAYIMFTSGSTGVPKGVEVTREALGLLASWAAAELELGLGTVVSQAAAVGFDASAWEVWPALLAGARLKIVPDAIRADPGEFAPWLLAHEVEVAFAPTPIAEMLIGMRWPATADLRVLGSGGDRLHPIPAGLPFRVLNLYGPTECTIVSVAAWVEPGEMPPIGHLVPHLYHRIVDATGTPVPTGVEGELWLGGPALARGYTGLPAETAARFIPDPHGGSAQHPAPRVYRTGDIVRERPDGQLEFLGRRDRQVKIGGARVEQGEVEATLLRLPGVRAAVTSVAEQRGVKRLVLHVVPDGTASQDSIVAAVAAALPPYLRSSKLMFADELPLTVNGKVDGAALASGGAPAAGGRGSAGSGASAGAAAAELPISAAAVAEAERLSSSRA